MRRGGRGNSVMDHGSPPNGLISQICTGALSGFAPCRARLLVKAISWPSGDHLGWPLLSLPRVSARVLSGAVRLERNRFETRASFSLSPVDFTQTRYSVFGEIRI